MSSREFADWMAFFRLEPFGYDVENWRTGMICALLANLLGSGKKRYTAKDFMPTEKREMTPMEQVQKFRAMTSKRDG